MWIEISIMVENIFTLFYILYFNTVFEHWNDVSKYCVETWNPQNSFVSCLHIKDRNIWQTLEKYLEIRQYLSYIILFILDITSQYIYINKTIIFCVINYETKKYSLGADGVRIDRLNRPTWKCHANNF